MNGMQVPSGIVAEEAVALTHGERVIARELGLDGAYRVLAGMEYCAVLIGNCTIRGLTVRRVERNFTYEAEDGLLSRDTAARYLAALAPRVTA